MSILDNAGHDPKQQPPAPADRHGKEIPSRDCLSHVECGDGAVMTMPNPFSEDSLEWGLRYGNPERMRFVAASVVSSYDYLISDAITMKEATRRLRLLRARRVELRNVAAASRDR